MARASAPPKVVLKNNTTASSNGAPARDNGKQAQKPKTKPQKTYKRKDKATRTDSSKPSIGTNKPRSGNKLHFDFNHTKILDKTSPSVFIVPKTTVRVLVRECAIITITRVLGLEYNEFFKKPWFYITKFEYLPAVEGGLFWDEYPGYDYLPGFKEKEEESFEPSEAIAEKICITMEKFHSNPDEYIQQYMESHDRKIYATGEKLEYGLKDGYWAFRPLEEN